VFRKLFSKFFRKINSRLLTEVEHGHLFAVQELLDKGADVNTKDIEGHTALMWAAGLGHNIIVQTLLDKGADVNAKNNDGLAALKIAKNEGLTEVVGFLKKAGATE
jgi:ankyrin repeat protein